ncbi:MAG: tetratricopeptide repeat protein [Deltaproteobacteria bacterium]|nr:tetratricopeptide repeat protein [Deltaproteobacteria bacterium]
MIQTTEITALDQAWRADPDGGYATLVALGSEHLRAGNAAEACACLERALVQRPDDANVQNLLGLSYFKANDLDRALQLFEKLVARFPDENAISLNLALVQLKAGKVETARDRLLAIVSRDPRHARAQNYLGLVYEQLREWRTAARAYAQGGNHKAAEEMLRRHGGRVAGETNKRGAAPDGEPAGPEPTSTDENPALAAVAAVAAAETAAAAAQTAIAPTMISSDIPRNADAPTAAVVDLGSVAPLESTAQVNLLDGMVLVRIDGQALLRADRWVGRFGDLTSQPAFRRQRGTETGEPLGGNQPILAVQGTGTALMRIDEHSAVTAALDGELFVVEPRLLALLGVCRHETGQLTMPDGALLSLLRVRGQGQLVMTADRRPARLRIALGVPALVLASSLLAFAGKVLPRVAPPGPRSAASPPMLQLLGEGEAWVDGGSQLPFEMPPGDAPK